MKNFALLNENNVVINISIADEDWDSTGWIDYTNKNCAIGYTYDTDADVFISPQPYVSWSLDSNLNWQPPVAYPTDGKLYGWFEPNQQWIEIVSLQN